MKSHALFDPAIVRGALIDSLRKLDPRHQARNPVMFVVMVGSVLTTALGVQALFGEGKRRLRSFSASAFGSGSLCSSVILPKPWRKAAARLRLTHFVRAAAM